ncbi:hypothetical protein J4G62_02210 [Aeromonas caviae]|uniref:hypothetical protein n=1 Tax=Aeromonas TaxID=642 RepID=UPI001BD603AF|nr:MULTISPECIES: hypothetical protein [Aeromonas]MBS4719073.1 hypothetical protein [Aeromonas caviae]
MRSDISFEDVLLSIQARVLSVSLPCGCRLSDGRYTHHCGGACEWFQWSELELSQAGKRALWTLLIQSGFDDIQHVSPADVLEYLDVSDNGTLPVSAADFHLSLMLGRDVLGITRQIVA